MASTKNLTLPFLFLVCSVSLKNTFIYKQEFQSCSKGEFFSGVEESNSEWLNQGKSVRGKNAIFQRENVKVASPKKLPPTKMSRPMRNIYAHFHNSAR
jgi:hypothetical protein